MSFALFLLLATALVMFSFGVLRIRKILTLPVVVAYLYLAFFVPQALHLERDVYGPWLNADFLFLYMTAALIALALGFYVTSSGLLGGPAEQRRKTTAFERWRLPGNVSAPMNKYEQKLLAGAIVLWLIGAVANYQLSATDTSELGNMWTGVATLWFLLGQSTFFSLAIAALLYARTGRKVYLIIGLLTLSAVLIGFGGNVKRHMIAETLIILGGSIFFVFNWRPPRVAVFAICFLGMVLLHQVGDVRAYIQRGEGTVVSAFVEGVPFERFSYFQADDAPELSIAALDIHYAREQDVAEGPVELWNDLVLRYVPAFALGRDFKDSLMMEHELAQEGMDYEMYATPGITHTGFSDTFRSFSYFGVLVFGLIGMLFGWLWKHALAGAFWAQFYYLILLNDALVAFTQSSARFLSGLPFILAVTLPFIWRFGQKVYHTRQARRRAHETADRPPATGRPA
ncbi:O-antigen polymerase [Aurantiacibacter sp. MUD61]|uniref:O-antigen polymerase n=1 Tax=Aurantiacibacter sp. MUD61 TaxID=3009083 RepID=UPI0022F0827B|nr:O-antigen polymerase [Aurantiacibacter sp. MUD61]